MNISDRDPMQSRGQVASQPSVADELLAQHERALSLLCGLHTYVTIDGPPEDVAQRIFDQVMADQRALRERITSLERTLAYFRAKRSVSESAI